MDGSPSHYDPDYCLDMMISHTNVLEAIEQSPHPEYLGDSFTETHIVTDVTPSALVTKVRKLEANR